MTEKVTDEVPEVCRSCRFGRGNDRACTLLVQGAQDLLLAEGPCRLDERIREEALALVRRRYPFARTIADDVASEALLTVLEGGSLLVPDKIHHLPVLMRRLREVVRNAVIDSLRHHRMITRLRCGACVHFDADSPPPGCHLPALPAIGSDLVEANPWFGSKVERTTDPRALDPRCGAFEWRRPDTHDILEGDVPGMSADGTPRERAINLLVQAIDRIARQDESGMRVASALFWHYLRGREVKDLAAEAGCSEKTIKRLLADGRERLLATLRDDFAVEDIGDILG